MLKNLRKLREESNTTQKQLAEVVGVSQQSINKYENHNVEPDIETLVRIANYFNTSVDYLIGRTEDTPVPAEILNEEQRRLLSAFCDLPKEQRRALLLITDALRTRS